MKKLIFNIINIIIKIISNVYTFLNYLLKTRKNKKIVSKVIVNPINYKENYSYKDLIINLITNRNYPYRLYNMYGSEGDGETRQYIDNCLEKLGFIETIILIKKSI